MNMKLIALMCVLVIASSCKQQPASEAKNADETTVQFNHGEALYQEGDYAGAEKEFRAVLAVRERILGPEHPATLISRNNLAVALGAQDKYAEAEREHRAVLAVEERMFGAKNPETATSRMGRAQILRMQNKNAEAEKELRVVLV